MRLSSPHFSLALARAFPTPALLVPPAAGIDISDSSIKWVVIEPHGSIKRLSTFGESALEPGIVVSGAVQDVEALGAVLKKVRKELGSVGCAHAALPEELAYVFSMHVPPGTAREQALRMIEFEFEDRVPIPPEATVFDFNALSDDRVLNDEIAVAVFPREVASAYAEAFRIAGIELLSLEIEARSIARACVSSGDPVTLLVDFGRGRTGFAVIKHGHPIFTSTVPVGGEGMTKVLMEKLSMTEEQAESFKNEQGLAPDDGQKSPGLELITPTASALADEVAKHFHYWDTRRNAHGEKMTPVGKVILVGGSANLKGLPDYIAGRVQAPTERGDVWHNVASFDEYIPPIDRHRSLQFATAIGLALRSM